jgi:hypothetical protein
MGEIKDTLNEGTGREPDFNKRVRGLVDQVKADYATGNQPADARGLLQQRLDQTGLDLAPAEIDALVREIEDTRS